MNYKVKENYDNNLRKPDRNNRKLYRGYLTGTFFCVAKTAVSTPLTATDVKPPWFIALNAYSAKCFEVICLTSSKLRITPCHGYPVWKST